MADKAKQSLARLPRFSLHSAASDSERLLSSDTLKRHPSMEMDKGDMLQLLSYMEGELQARDVTIAALKLEKVKSLLGRAKYGCASVTNPVNALQRDSELAKDTSYDDTSVRAMYCDQLAQLENLITSQHVCQQQMRDQLVAVEKQYHRTCAELEDVKKSHGVELEELNVVVQLLTRDRDRLQQEIDSERSKSQKLEEDLKNTVSCGADDQTTVAKHRQVALLLIRERSRLVAKLLETRKHGTELQRQVTEERDRAQSLSDSLDRQLAECEQLCSRLSSAESLNRSLQAELTQLQSRAGSAGSQDTAPLAASAAPTAAAVITGLNRPTQTPPHATRINVSTTPSGDFWKLPNGPSAHPASGQRTPQLASASVSRLDDVARQRSPRDRDVAAARLRSILTSAMDSSPSQDVAAAGTGPVRRSVRLPSGPSGRLDQPPVLSRSVPTPLSRLPAMSQTASLSSSMTGPLSRRYVAPAFDVDTDPTTVQPHPPTAEQHRLPGRLTPLSSTSRANISASSHRLEPLPAAVPGQSNGMLPGSSLLTGSQKPNSLH